MSSEIDIRFFRETLSGRPAEILDAALGVFSEHGYEGGSMRQIAQHVGISEPALYRHFAGKEDLFLTIIEQTGLRLHAEVEPMFSDLDPARLTETLDSVFEDRRRVARGPYVPVIKAILVASAHNPRFLDAFRDAVIGPVATYLYQIVPVLDTYYEVEVGPQDIEQRVQTVISIFIGYMLMTFLFETEATPVSETIVRVMQWTSS